MVSRLRRMARTTPDLARATAFYRDALGFQVRHERFLEGPCWSELTGIPAVRGRSVLMCLGEQELELVRFEPPGRPYPNHSCATDPWFQHIAIVVSDMGAAYEHLRGYRYRPISAGGPQQLRPNTGSVVAFKFRDPDGHPLELIQFPPGTGAPRWQHQGALFLGIDHSAITVADLRQSIGFYNGLLGFRVAAQSVNSGRAQEQLDGVAGDVVDVVALAPAAPGPPHVELLGYQQPRTERMPLCAASNDVYADRLVLDVDPLAPLIGMLHHAGVHFVSREAVALSPAPQATLIRDPTGHLLLLCQERAPGGAPPSSSRN